MERKRRIQRTSVPSSPLTPDLLPDPLTRYVYDHYSELLTAEERAANRFRMYRIKAWRPGTEEVPGRREFYRITEIEQQFPEMMRRIQSEGAAAVMAAARDRVLREHAGAVVLNRCARCGELCRTPQARQCLACGYDWHGQAEL